MALSVYIIRSPGLLAEDIEYVEEAADDANDDALHGSTDESMADDSISEGET